MLKVTIELASGDSLGYKCSPEQAGEALKGWINGCKYIILGERHVCCFDANGNIWIKNIKFEMK